MIQGRLEWLGAVIVIVTAILLVYIFVAATRSEGQPPLQPSLYDDRLNVLDRESIERAYSNQMVRLFDVWMKDGTGQPARALTGQRQARRAYIESMTAIGERRP